MDYINWKPLFAPRIQKLNFENKLEIIFYNLL